MQIEENSRSHPSEYDAQDDETTDQDKLPSKGDYINIPSNAFLTKILHKQGHIRYFI